LEGKPADRKPQQEKAASAPAAHPTRADVLLENGDI
jgi:hypothetical protein